MAALFMVFLFLSFLVADILVRRFQAAKEPATAGEGIYSRAGIPVEINPNDIALPAGLFYHRGHTWAKVDISGKVFIGIDDFLQKILGRIDNISIPKEGEVIAQNEKLIAVQQGKRKASFLSPVDGVVEKINEDAIKNFDATKKAPYEKGWLIAVKPTNLSENIKSLFIADGARTWIKTEIARFKEFLSEQFLQDKRLGQTMADGGAVVEGIMEHMDDFSWIKFEEEFLQQ